MRIKAGKTVLFASSRIHFWDWILILGLCLAPMTEFRFWKIGPGEILCILWAIHGLFSCKCKIRRGDIASFFSFFYAALIVGSVFGYFIAPDELRLPDLFTWLYLGIITLSIYTDLHNRSEAYNEQLFYTFARISTAWFFFLYVFSLTIKNSFLGASLWYSPTRFSGGASNPHQLAVLLCGLVFVFFRKILNKQRILTNAIFLSISLFLMLETASSTGILSIAVVIAILLYFYIGGKFHKYRLAALIAILFFVLFVVLLGASFILNLFMEWVEKDPNGLGRIEIFSSFYLTFSKSPLFGLGPGVHGLNGYIEYHNTYLEILAASGLLGFLIFVVYSIRFFKSVLRADWTLFPIVVSLYAYGFAGFAMRRLVYWGIIAFLTVIAEQRLPKKLI